VHSTNSGLRHSDHRLVVQFARWQFCTAGPEWLSQLYYDYYLFTGDREFLETRTVPLMKKALLKVKLDTAGKSSI